MSVSADQKLLATGAPSRRTPSRHARRFQLVFAALFVVCLASLALAVALTSGPRHRTVAGDWSSWSPSDGGLAGAQEIADYLAPQYRASPAVQLAVVTAVDLNDPANPLEVVVPANGSSGALTPLPAGSTILYNLCGEGSGNCSIGTGQPSSSRLLLLRREALALSLYTFKYLGNVQAVVAILPPGHTVEGCTGICSPKLQTKTTVKPVNVAVVFDRQELQPWLERPLRETLPEDIPPTVSQMPDAPEAELVSVITAHGLFSEDVEQSQTGSSMVVLNPLPPQ